MLSCPSTSFLPKTSSHPTTPTGRWKAHSDTLDPTLLNKNDTSWCKSIYESVLSEGLLPAFCLYSVLAYFETHLYYCYGIIVTYCSWFLALKNSCSLLTVCGNTRKTHVYNMCSYLYYLLKVHWNHCMTISIFTAVNFPPLSLLPDSLCFSVFFSVHSLSSCCGWTLDCAQAFYW